MLPYAGLSSSRISPWPTWVPDWRDLPDSLRPCAYRAQYSVQSETQVCIRPTKDIKRILIRGQHIDRVRLLSVAFPWADPQLLWSTFGKSEGTSVIEAYFAQVEGFACNLDPYMNGQSAMEACWRTIVANKHLDGWALPQTYDMHEVKARKEVAMAEDDGLLVKTIGKEPYFAAENFTNALQLMGRYLFDITDRDLMGMFPLGMAVGDEVYILYGHPLPFILRRKSSESLEDEEVYQCFGECYVRGIMDGQQVQVHLSKDNCLV